MSNQKQLSGMKDEVDVDLTRAAKNYRKAVDDRQKKNVILVGAKAVLLDLMKARGKKVYRDPEEDIVVEIEEGKVVLTVRGADDEAKKEPDDQPA